MGVKGSKKAKQRQGTVTSSWIAADVSVTAAASVAEASTAGQLII